MDSFHDWYLFIQSFHKLGFIAHYVPIPILCALYTDINSWERYVVKTTLKKVKARNTMFYTLAKQPDPKPFLSLTFLAVCFR